MSQVIIGPAGYNIKWIFKHHVYYYVNDFSFFHSFTRAAELAKDKEPGTCQQLPTKMKMMMTKMMVLSKMKRKGKNDEKMLWQENLEKKHSKNIAEN